MNKSERKIVAYTDGACSPNPGVGGWGWVSYEERELCPHNPRTMATIVKSYGGLKETTNNQMELTAMIDFLESCPKGECVCIDVYSDSDYVLGGIVGPKTRVLTRVESQPQGWIRGWLEVRRLNSKNTLSYHENYWKKGKDMPNGEEWYKIHQALLMHARCNTVLNFCWVKGHSGVEGNEEADRLANKFAKRNKK
jgi:ribonuclease HI